MSEVLTQAENGVLIITINRPEAKNAVNQAVAQGLAAAMEQLDSDKSLNAGIITGAGGTFCSGMDLKAFLRGELPSVKGKGFAGTIKRHSFSRGPETHGADHHREPGSIGAGTTPGRVYRGTRMAGHMGVDRTTIQKVTIVRADGAQNLLLLKGSVPGAKNALVIVSKAEQI